MLDYILHIVAFQLLFLLGYELLLKRETFFNWNRWYLLITAVLSLILPLVQIEGLSAVVPAEAVNGISGVFLPDVLVGESLQNLPEASSHSTSISYSSNWWLIIYGAGVLVSLILLIKKYFVLSRLFRFETVSTEGDFRIIEVPDSNIACTFYKTIFLGDKLSEAEKKHIFPHELVHAKQKHSLDLLFFELYKIIFWFNPLVYVYQMKIATLHEFIADAIVVEHTGKKSYYEQLLNSAFNTTNISFTNSFFNHLLIRLSAFGKTINVINSGGQVKNRIIMLNKSRSKTISKLKYLMLAPLLMVMLTAVAYSGTNEQDMPEILNEKSVNQISQETLQETVIPFAVVQEVPVFPGCNQEQYEARKECLVEKITDHVNRNFNLSAVKPHMASGMNRIMVQFKIDRNGVVTNVRSRMVTPGPSRDAKAFMEEEANRVVASLPKMKPARHEGKEVGVMYFLPIQFGAPENQG